MGGVLVVVLDIAINILMKMEILVFLTKKMLSTRYIVIWI